MPTKRSRRPASQPALSLGQGVGVAPHRVDEHHLAHAREHRLAARPLRARFEDRLLRELRDPRVVAAGLKVQHPRQRLDQRIERLQVAAEKAADDRRVGAVFGRRCSRHVEAVVGDLHRPALAGDLREPVEVDPAAHAGRARDDVRIAVREHDDVAGAELHRRPARDGGPARAGGDDVVLHHVLDAAQQERRDLPRRRRFGDPAAVAADREEDGAAQANVAQDVGERVVVHSVRSGVSVKPAGRSVKGRERAPATADGRASRDDAGSCARTDGAEE